MAKRGEMDQPASERPEVRQLITGTALERILRASRSASKEVASINGKVRDKIKKDAYANDLVRSKVALSLVRRLDNLEAEDLALFFEDFDHMADVGGLRKRAESATGDMFAEVEEPADDGAPARKPKPRKPRKTEAIEGNGDGRTRQPAEMPG